MQGLHGKKDAASYSASKCRAALPLLTGTSVSARGRPSAHYSCRRPMMQSSTGRLTCDTSRSCTLAELAAPRRKSRISGHDTSYRSNSNTRVKTTLPELPEMVSVQARASPAAAWGARFRATVASHKSRQSSSVSSAVLASHPKGLIWARQGPETAKSNPIAITDGDNRRRCVIWSPVTMFSHYLMAVVKVRVECGSRVILPFTPSPPGQAWRNNG